VRNQRLLLAAVLCLPAAVCGCARATRAVPAPELLVVHAEPVVEAAQPAEKREPKPAPIEGFEFPKDKGGQELAKSLPAGVGVTLLPDSPARPRPHTPPRSLTDLSLPLSPVEVGPARPPAVKSPPPPRPGKVKEDAPLIGYLGSPQTPVADPLPTGALARAPSPDVAAPPAPPVLGQPTSDRAPLDAPTAEASREAALAAQPPARTNPTPFQKNNLPDPFENRQTGRLRTPPPEDPTPTASRPAKP
jgi:hypothetical protein